MMYRSFSELLALRKGLRKNKIIYPYLMMAKSWLFPCPSQIDCIKYSVIHCYYQCCFTAKCGVDAYFLRLSGPEMLLRKSSDLGSNSRTQAYYEGNVGDALEAHNWKCVRTINGTLLLNTLIFVFSIMARVIIIFFTCWLEFSVCSNDLSSGIDPILGNMSLSVEKIINS